jgi:hypothetical protein
LKIDFIFLLKSAKITTLAPGSGYFGEDVADRSTSKSGLVGYKLSENELYIGKLLFHFQTGIQYNLHAVYQVPPRIHFPSIPEASFFHREFTSGDELCPVP